MRYIYGLLIIVVTALVLFFVVQNTLSTTVTFFSASVTLPLSILVLVTFALGILTGGFVASILRVLTPGSAKNQNNT